MNIIIIHEPWHCHDGWATSLNIYHNGESDEQLINQCRQRFALWYRSARTKERAEQRLQEKIAVARSIAGDLPVIVTGSAEAKNYFAQHPEH
ncbi:MAG: hypothetical protein A2Y38_01370 [Spirochaetes bacterium GWB1_59_5]|nr:MAG: hypothetical protein A2Y38_01370 [Spirochaetes bacterium GWB1_59_5]